MKSNIVGLLYIVASAPFLLIFLVTFVYPLVYQNGRIDSDMQIVFGVLSLILGTFSLFFGSALRKHKKWAWYIGIILIPLVTIGNTISLISYFNIVQILVLLVNVFSVYALISERKLFFI